VSAARVFDPDREDNQHFGFGGSLHYCVGAPLARVETEAALVALATRARAPRLLQDPPPYRDGASLRGPLRLDLAIEASRTEPPRQRTNVFLTLRDRSMYGMKMAHDTRAAASWLYAVWRPSFPGRRSATMLSTRTRTAPAVLTQM